MSSMIHLNKRKKIRRWNWYTQFQTLDCHFNRFFPTFITQVLAQVSYLVVDLFHGYRIRHPWKYYENTNSEKMRTLLARYTFTGFALPCFQTATSCPLRGLFSIGWETKQLSCFPFKFALFTNHNNKNKNNNILSFTKFSKPCSPMSRNYSPKFKLHAVNSKITIDFWSKTRKTILKSNANIVYSLYIIIIMIIVISMLSILWSLYSKLAEQESFNFTLKNIEWFRIFNVYW